VCGEHRSGIAPARAGSRCAADKLPADQRDQAGSIIDKAKEMVDRLDDDEDDDPVGGAASSERR
jgi:hypothetical protein